MNAWQREKGVADHRYRSSVLKVSLPEGPSVHPRNTEDPSIRGWANRARRRVEMKQRGMEKLYYNVEADESFNFIYILNPAPDW